MIDKEIWDSKESLCIGPSIETEFISTCIHAKQFIEVPKGDVLFTHENTYNLLKGDRNMLFNHKKDSEQLKEEQSMSQKNLKRRRRRS